MEVSLMASQPELHKTLKPRHLSMIAIAGVIGAGLFVGSGAAIKQAGPGILLAYAAAGLVVILVMRMLGEMAAANPETGSFSAYADKALGRWAGFSIGWLYAWFWIIVLGIEATAGAAIMHRWLPGVDQWIWALVLMVALTLTNVWSVKSYGEFEFWFASVKVTAIILFLIAGIAAIFGLIPGLPAPGTTNLLGHGGLMPNGGSAVLAGILVVVFSFFGAEIATIAAGESADPVTAVRKAVNSTVWRILVFYIGSMAIVVTLLPWDDASVAKSPYVAVIERFGVPGAGTIMDIVVLTSVLSCLNSGLYTASRMIFSLSTRGDAPSSWSRISPPRRPGPRGARLHSGRLRHGGPELPVARHGVPVPGQHLGRDRAVRVARHRRLPADPAPPGRCCRHEARDPHVAVPVPDVGVHRGDRRPARGHALPRRHP
jgi:GABA permease